MFFALSPLEWQCLYEKYVSVPLNNNGRFFLTVGSLKHTLSVAEFEFKELSLLGNPGSKSANISLHLHGWAVYCTEA